MTNLSAEFDAFIAAKDFPCVGAKSAQARDTLTTVEAEDISCPDDDGTVHRALCAFGRSLNPEAAFVQSCAVIYRGPLCLGERDFEAALWRRLQALHDLDRASGHSWAKGVSGDPRSPHFSLSIGGHGFFVVGLHDAASRPGRRFRHPTLVFNPHEQFEQLRADGRYQKLQTAIRARDRALAGSINPMLGDFGRSSEARQYSGRAVGPRWSCPFQPRGRQ